MFSFSAEWWLSVVIHDLSLLYLVSLLALLSVFLWLKCFRPESTSAPKYKSHGESAVANNRFGIVSALAVWSVAFCYVYNLTLVSVTIQRIVPMSCRTLFRAAAPVYQLAKWIMAVLWFTRIDAIYGGTKYAFSRRLLHAAIAMTSLVNGALIYCYIADFVPVNTRDNHYGRLCRVHAPLWVATTALLLEIAVSISCLHMFTSPLRKMIREQSGDGTSMNSTVTSTNRRVRRVAAKYTVVTWTAVLTTAAVIVSVLVFKNVLFGPLDQCINATCFALMTNWFDGYYHTLCALPIACAKHLCALNPVEMEGEQMQLAAVVSDTVRSQVTVD